MYFSYSRSNRSRWIGCVLEFYKDTINDDVIKDLSNVGWDARITGVVKIAGGKFGDAVRFEGDQNNYIQGAKSLEVFKEKSTKSISIEGWIIDEGFIEWEGYVVCTQRNGSFEKGWVFGANNIVSFAVSTKELDDGNGILTYVKPAKKPNRGEWFHMAGIYDGGTIRLYIDG